MGTATTKQKEDQPGPLSNEEEETDNQTARKTEGNRSQEQTIQEAAAAKISQYYSKYYSEYSKYGQH